MLYLRKQCDNTFAFRVNVAKIKEDGNFLLKKTAYLLPD